MVALPTSKTVKTMQDEKQETSAEDARLSDTKIITEANPREGTLAKATETIQQPAGKEDARGCVEQPHWQNHLEGSKGVRQGMGHETREPSLTSRSGKTSKPPKWTKKEQEGSSSVTEATNQGRDHKAWSTRRVQSGCGNHQNLGRSGNFNEEHHGRDREAKLNKRGSKAHRHAYCREIESQDDRSPSDGYTHPRKDGNESWKKNDKKSQEKAAKKHIHAPRMGPEYLRDPKQYGLKYAPPKGPRAQIQNKTYRSGVDEGLRDPSVGTPGGTSRSSSPPRTMDDKHLVLEREREKYEEDRENFSRRQKGNNHDNDRGRGYAG
jgi:hypothetical protein